MLKRQRPVSPPPSSNANVPLITEPSMVDMATKQAAKRRRILPPSLEGRCRDWDMASPLESDELDWDAEQETGDAEIPPDPREYAKGYELTNKLLCELHKSQQRRHPSLHNPSYTYLGHPNERCFPSQGTRTHSPPTFVRSNPNSATAAFGRHSSREALRDDEQCAKDLYEDTNRSLGEAFLARRRELISPTRQSQS